MQGTLPCVALAGGLPGSPLPQTLRTGRPSGLAASQQMDHTVLRALTLAVPDTALLSIPLVSGDALGPVLCAVSIVIDRITVSGV